MEIALNNLVELKTSDNLLKALEVASSKILTAKEINEQRVSFIVGMKGSSSITKSRIQEMLAYQDGSKT